MLTRLILALFLAFAVSTVHAQYTPADAKLPINIYVGRRLLYESPDGPLPKYMEYLISSNDKRLPELLFFIRDHISNLTADIPNTEWGWGNPYDFSTSFWCYTSQCIAKFQEFDMLKPMNLPISFGESIAKYAKKHVLSSVEYNATTSKSGFINYIFDSPSYVSLLLKVVRDNVGTVSSYSGDPSNIDYMVAHAHNYLLSLVCFHSKCVQKFRDAGLA